MMEPFDGEGPGPGLWAQLLRSGFFFVDFPRKTATPSRLMDELGYQASDFLDGTFLAAIHPGDRPTHQGLWNRLQDGQEDEFLAEYRIRTPKGGYRWVQTYTLVVARTFEGGVGQLFGMDRDIGLRKQSESLLHSRFLDLERRFLMSESLRVAGSVVTSSLDLDSTIPAVLDQAATLFPFHGARVWAFTGHHLDLLGQEESSGPPELYSPPTEALVLRVVKEKTPFIVDDLAHRLKDTDSRPHASWIGVPLLFQGQARGVMEFWHQEPGFFRSEHIWPAMAFADNVAVGLFNARQFRATQEEGELDALTGLPTRKRWDRLGPVLFREALARQDDLTVFMVDLDHFKAVNDTRGHAHGDAVLRHFAQVSLSVLRKGDLICRYGGDEFIAMLPHTGSEEGAAVAERLHGLFKSRPLPEGPPVSLSMGISHLRRRPHQELKTLVEEADAALYRVKSRGRDGIAVFSDEGHPQP